MPKREKRLRKILESPAQVSFADLCAVLESFGWEGAWPSGGSSHRIYRKDGKIITIPFKRPHVREHYVKNVIAMLELETDNELDDSE